jgi:uncharacterized protein (TIGR00255 family)
MTGFGRGTAEANGNRSTVDIRAVNHRFLDLKLRGAVLAPALEEAINAKVRATIERGSVVVSINVTRPVAMGATKIDEHAAAGAHAQLSALARTLGVNGPDLPMILAQPGVVVPADDRLTDDAPIDPVVLSALDGAIAQLVAMREAEGQALGADLAGRFAELAALRVQLATIAASVPGAVAKRISERVAKLLEDRTEVDPARLAQEIALLADRSDVTEELVRLASHLDQCLALVGGKAPAGRRLDFLCQELGRELNTIGSKSASADLTAAVVEGKAVLEKLREQVQNVE